MMHTLRSLKHEKVALILFNQQFLLQSYLTSICSFEAKNIEIKISKYSDTNGTLRR